jgi:hypothetical protein
VAHYRVEAKLGHGGMGCGPTHVEHFR